MPHFLFFYKAVESLSEPALRIMTSKDCHYFLAERQLHRHLVDKLFNVLRDRTPVNIPAKVPVPVDDGACDHLLNQPLASDVLLRATLPAAQADDESTHHLSPYVSVGELSQNGLVILFIYPRSAPPDGNVPEEWKAIPGSTGCTPQSCAYRDAYPSLLSAGLHPGHLFGCSVQEPADHAEFSARLCLPYALLSDGDLVLQRGLSLPTFEWEGQTLTRRLTLAVDKGRVVKFWYPVFPPEKDVDTVLAWLKALREWRLSAISGVPLIYVRPLCVYINFSMFGTYGSTTSSRQPDGFPSEAVKVALAESIALGTFADTAYVLYSRRVRGGKVGAARKVYASSTVLKAAGDHFRAQIEGGFATREILPEETDAYGYESDSDIDDLEGSAPSDVAEKELGPVEIEDQGEGAGPSLFDDGKDRDFDVAEKKRHSLETESRAVDADAMPSEYCIAVPDVAAKTWHALIYYIYTGQISFAPLRSQGQESRAKALEKHRLANPALPALCSPKSVYRLADIVGLDALKQLAAENLSSKMSADVIVQEVFSRFSSTYPDVLAQQLNYLCKRNILSKRSPAVRQKLKDVVEGNLPHTENLLEALLFRLSDLISSSPEVPVSIAVIITVTARETLKNLSGRKFSGAGAGLFGIATAQPATRFSSVQRYSGTTSISQSGKKKKGGKRY
ncbi:hypothetical protein NM688_g973 [Phlebia brevispora]|uniref:Uncharacterized protein n=1 Tax=Phlebia brevispora TaxID=194682 RepID=A0ACC1TD11_9APHY|nr:hypothetical protein NM688_g973 [Phlebia brevispora]